MWFRLAASITRSNIQKDSLFFQTFVDSILAKDRSVSIILAGDMNDFVQTRTVFHPLHSLLHDNDVADIDPVERYTYVYEQHAQEIDHIFVSDAVAKRGAEVEHGACQYVGTECVCEGERS